MPRGYRCIVLAAVGWLALAGAAPPNKQPVDANSGHDVGPSVTPRSDYSPYPDVKADKCYQAKDHDTADLCAQWRAAFAAEESTHLANWGNWISGIAAFFSAASVLLVVLALRQTERTLRLAHKDRADATRRNIAQSKETERALGFARQNAAAAADAAKTGKKQLAAALKTAEAQRQLLTTEVRPYVALTDMQFGWPPDSPEPFLLTAELKNGGITPAVKVESKIGLFFGPGGSAETPAEVRFNTSAAAFIGRDVPMRRDATLPTLATKDVRARIESGYTLYVVGEVTYQDILGNDYQTTFRFYVDAHTINTTAPISIAATGNKMT